MEKENENQRINCVAMQQPNLLLSSNFRANIRIYGMLLLVEFVREVGFGGGWGVIKQMFTNAVLKKASIICFQR